MSIVYFLVGLPGTGKTTFRNIINSKGDYAVISSDDYIEEFAKNNNMTYSEYFPNANMKYIKSLYMKKFNENIVNNENIILDFTFMSAKSRNRFLSKIPKSYKKICRIFEIDEKIHKERLFNRGIDTGKWIKDHIISEMKNTYITPSLTEGFDIIEYN